MKVKALFLSLLVTTIASSHAIAGDLSEILGIIGGVAGIAACKKRDSAGECVLKGLGGAAAGVVVGAVLEDVLDREDRRVYHDSYRYADEMNQSYRWRGRNAYGETRWVETGYYQTTTETYTECRRYVVTYWAYGRQYLDERATCYTQTRQTVVYQDPYAPGFTWGRPYRPGYGHDYDNGYDNDYDYGRPRYSKSEYCADQGMRYNRNADACESRAYRNRNKCFRAGGVYFDPNRRACGFEILF